MENKTHIPRWFKDAVAKAEGLGKGKADKAAWEAIERQLGPCEAESVTLDGGEALRITREVPSAFAQETIPWDRVESFQVRYRVGMSIQFEGRAGVSVCILDFLPEKS